jgi:hypothetical protein
MEIEGNQKIEFSVVDNLQTFTTKLQFTLLKVLDNIFMLIMMITQNGLDIYILSRDGVAVDGFWIGNRIYWILTKHNYN